MTRYEILLKKPVPIPIQPPEIPKYYMGMDVSYSTRDKNAIAITHMNGDNVIVDFIDHRAYHMDTIVEWASDLSKKWSIRQGIVDEAHMARVLGLDYVPSITSEMSHIFDRYKENIISGYSRELLENQDVKDALIRSVWLSVKNEFCPARAENGRFTFYEKI